MNTGYTTTHMAFASLLYWLYSDSCLCRVEMEMGRTDKTPAVFMFNIDKQECIDLFKTFLNGELAISDLKSYDECRAKLSRLVRDMRRKNQTVWESDDIVVAPEIAHRSRQVRN